MPLKVTGVRLLPCGTLFPAELSKNSFERLGSINSTGADLSLGKNSKKPVFIQRITTKHTDAEHYICDVEPLAP
jgi:hypothetical protein